MHEHYNLYYIFLEDRLANPMSEEKRKQIRNTLIKMFEGGKIKKSEKNKTKLKLDPLNK